MGFILWSCFGFVSIGTAFGTVGEVWIGFGEQDSRDVSMATIVLLLCPLCIEQRRTVGSGSQDDFHLYQH